MSQGRIAAGFLAAVGLGGGAGAGILPLAAHLQPPQVEAAAPSALTEEFVVVERVEGPARARMAGGGWGPVQAGMRLPAPTVVRTEGEGTRVRLEVAGARLELRDDATVHVGVVTPRMSFLVEAGLVLFASERRPVSVRVPSHDAVVDGQFLAVTVRPERAGIAVLDADVELSHRGKKAELHGSGREFVLAGGKLEPSLLPDRLTLEEDDTPGRGAGRIACRTSPTAIVELRRGGRRERVPVDFGGLFSVAGPRPQPGELVATDSAGRRAELDRPSETLEDLVEQLVVRREVPPPPRPEPQPASPEPVVEAKPAERPEAEDPEALRRIGGGLPTARPRPSPSPPAARPAGEARAPAEVRPADVASARAAEAPARDGSDAGTPPPTATAVDRSERLRGGGTPEPVRLDLDGPDTPEVRPAGLEKPEARLPRALRPRTDVDAGP